MFGKVDTTEMYQLVIPIFHCHSTTFLSDALYIIYTLFSLYIYAATTCLLFNVAVELATRATAINPTWQLLFYHDLFFAAWQLLLVLHGNC